MEETRPDARVAPGTRPADPLIPFTLRPALELLLRCRSGRTAPHHAAPVRRCPDGRMRGGAGVACAGPVLATSRGLEVAALCRRGLTDERDRPDGPAYRAADDSVGADRV